MITCWWLRLFFVKNISILYLMQMPDVWHVSRVKHLLVKWKFIQWRMVKIASTHASSRSCMKFSKMKSVNEMCEQSKEHDILFSILIWLHATELWIWTNVNFHVFFSFPLFLLLDLSITFITHVGAHLHLKFKMQICTMCVCASTNEVAAANGITYLMLVCICYQTKTMFASMKWGVFQCLAIDLCVQQCTVYRLLYGIEIRSQIMHISMTDSI